MSRKTLEPGLRIGVDFGSGYTGVALLDGRNVVLAREVIEHRKDVSGALQGRREFRAMRRRANSRRARLREFRALLAEMKPDEAVGEKLLALAHRRGWDYSTLQELLADESGDRPRETDTVRLADDYLKGKVPPARLEKLDGKTKDPEVMQKREQAAEFLAKGERPPDNLLRHVKLRQTCLGEFAAQLRNALDAENGDNEDDAADMRQAAEAIRDKLQTLNGVSEWLDERLDIVFGGEAPHEARDDAREHILALLGVKNRRDIFESGNDYRPHNRRHREKALEELQKILDENGLGQWMRRARAVLNRPHRKKRFKNRSPGKCRACAGKPDNLPLRVKVRRLLFQIEALQMRVYEDDGEIRNLRPDEMAELLKIVDFRNGKIRDREKWREFFDRIPKPPKNADDEDDGDDAPQTKRAQLRAIAESVLEGRVPGLCRACLTKKVELLKIPKAERGDEWREQWNALARERILGLQDAAPSLRQKVERVRERIIRMLKNAGFEKPVEAPVECIGVERAAFDIVAASSASGKRPKKSQYGKRRPRGPAELLRQQGELCIYCGKHPGAELTVDHFIPRAAGGGDSHKNRLAACMACNLQKSNLGGVQFNPDAIAALRENDPEKAAYLEKNRGKLSADNLSAPQQTMLGVKILRGELARAIFGNTALAADKTKFPVVRAQDAAALRRLWFENIARQKSALRAAVPEDAFVVHPGDKPKRLNGNIAADQQIPEFIREESGKIIIAPQEGKDHEGVHSIQLEEVREWEVPAGPPRKINLKNEKIRGRLVRVNGKDPFAPGLPVRWKIHKRELTLCAEKSTAVRLTFAPRLRVVVRPKKRDPVEKYHHAVDAIVAAADKKWDKIVLLARDPEKRSDARVRKLLNESGRPRGPLAEDAVPPNDAEPWLFKDEKNKGGPKRPRLKANPVRRGRPHLFPKGGGEPRKTADFTQRVPLDKLGRKKIPQIHDSAVAIREALESAWNEIDRLPPEERKKAAGKIPGDEVILAEWFLKKQREAWDEINRLPAKERARFVRVDDRGREVICGEWFRADPERRNFLHPKRVRSVPVKVSPGQPFPVYRTAGGREHVHLFWCEPPLWNEVAVWEEKQGEKTVRKTSRKRPAFYRPGSPFPHKPRPAPRKDDLPEWENGPPPDGALRIRPGMKVRVEGEAGLWRILGLEDRRAQMIPADDEARNFAESAGDDAKTDNLLWRGRKVRRDDKYHPDGNENPDRTVPGLWRLDDLDEQAGLTPDDDEARRAVEKGATMAVNFKRLRVAQADEPAIGGEVRRIGTTALPGIWRVEARTGKKGEVAILPRDDTARRAARNQKKRANYAKLRPAAA